MSARLAELFRSATGRRSPPRIVYDAEGDGVCHLLSDGFSGSPSFHSNFNSNSNPDSEDFGAPLEPAADLGWQPVYTRGGLDDDNEDDEGCLAELSDDACDPVSVSEELPQRGSLSRAGSPVGLPRSTSLPNHSDFLRPQQQRGKARRQRAACVNLNSSSNTLLNNPTNPLMVPSSTQLLERKRTRRQRSAKNSASNSVSASPGTATPDWRRPRFASMLSETSGAGLASESSVRNEEGPLAEPHADTESCQPPVVPEEDHMLGRRRSHTAQAKAEAKIRLQALQKALARMEVSTEQPEEDSPSTPSAPSSPSVVSPRDDETGHEADDDDEPLVAPADLKMTPSPVISANASQATGCCVPAWSQEISDSVSALNGRSRSQSMSFDEHFRIHLQLRHNRGLVQQ